MDNISVDTITSLLKKVTTILTNLDTSSILGLILAVGFMTLIYGLVSESILNANTIIISLFVSTIVYIYLKNSYSRKLNELEVKNRVLKTDSILDDLCMGTSVGDKNTCDKYKQAKTNFYQISNALIQNYNWKK